MDANKTQFFDDHAESYESSLFQHDYFISLKCLMVEKIIRDRFTIKPVLADFGCGTGETLAILSPMAEKCFGIDSSQGMIAQAKKKNIANADFAQEDCSKTSLADNSIDIAMVMGVLHHVYGYSNKLNILKEMMRTVTIGGFIMVFEHNPWNPITRHIVKRVPVDQDARLISPSYMRLLCKSANYNKVTTKYLAFFPRQLAPLSKFEQFFNRIPFGGQYLVLAEKNT